MKRNKKGFTLIELLAVIVILAIIALIATPIVLNIIQDANENAVLSSAKNYLHAVDLAVMDENLTKEFKPTTCTVLSNGNLNCVGYQDEVQIKMKGQKPNSGTISFASKKIDTATLYISDYIVDLNNKEYTIRKADSSNKSTKEYKEGDVVYFNVDEGGKCDNYTEAQSAAGVKSGCMKFYVLNVYEDSLDLILDHNVYDAAGWDYDSYYHTDFLYVLYGMTRNWKGTLPPENYTGVFDNGETYTIDYTKFYDSITGIQTGPYKARLPKIEEVISKVKWYQQLSETDKNNWMALYNPAFENYVSNEIPLLVMEELGLTDEDIENGNFDQELVMNKMMELTKTSKFSIPEWLGFNLEEESTYWTASANVNETSSIWNIGIPRGANFAMITSFQIGNNSSVRPVIKVLKSTVENKGIPVSKVLEPQPLEEVYFDVTNGDICTNYTSTQSLFGVTSGCMKFYVLNKNSEKAVLILDHDIAENISWSDSCYEYNSSALLSKIESLTSSWNGVLPLSKYTAANGLELDYTKLKARLPEFEEILMTTQWYKSLEDKTSIIDKFSNANKKVLHEGYFDYFLDPSFGEEGLTEYINKSEIGLPASLHTSENYWLSTPYLEEEGYNVYIIAKTAPARKVVCARDGYNLRPVIEISADLID